MVSALEIAGPMAAALFLAEAALGLLARAAPQLNPLMLGFPLRILLTLVLVGAAIPLLPNAMDNLVGQVLRSWGAALRLLPGG
jgi:flagellar biosynthetic protein FliR